MKRDNRLNPCAVYRLFNEAGELLYIGMASNVVQRACSHALSSWFCSVIRIELEWLPNRNAAQMAEKIAIETEKPRHNVRYNGEKEYHRKKRGLRETPTEKVEIYEGWQRPTVSRKFLATLGPVWQRLYRDVL